MAKHTNHLIHESSPYLLQHAHNPVNWYPWGEEALAKAKREDKPILVSIGYSACHWCHVMERESFEDEESADIMNSYFVNIKIDREERPDLDQIYMDAVQAMNGNGGWPLNVFLTPDKKPFYGGTYFPPSRIHNRASWKEVLSGIILAWRDRRDEVEEQAMQLVQHIRQSAELGTGLKPLTDPSGENIFVREDIDKMFSQIMKSADRQWGGFGRAPKFPQSFIIRFLLQYHYFTGDENALQQARLSLDKMIQGGIYDQVGGGFARYSTDTEWLAPHFEKMTYDNALLINVLADAFQLTNDEAYSRTIRHTISFMEREMMSPEGGFFAALDADSEGVEGKFYTWTKTEFDEVSGEDAALFSEFFDVSATGNWEHTNILWVRKRAEDFVEEKGIPGADFNNKLQSLKERLLKRRESRVRPLTDDKCLLGWNALMNTALTKAYNALGDERYLDLAKRNMQFLFENLKSRATGEWRHTFKNGEAKFHAFLDDYAYLIEALITLHESSGYPAYLKQAAEITQYVLDHFSDENSPYFFYTPDTQEDVIVRKKDIYDGATPSANAVMVFNLFRLGLLLERREWTEKAYRLIEGSRDLIIRYPLSFGNWATIFTEQAAGIQEIVVIGKGALLKAREILRQYIPNKALQFAEVADASMPMMRNKKPEERIVYYLCRDYSCKKPVYELGELLQLIETEKQRL